MSLPVAILLGLILAAAALVVDHFIRASIRRKRLAEGRERAAAVMDRGSFNGTFALARSVGQGEDYGNRRNFRKSGLRFSRYAFLPSCPSSDR